MKLISALAAASVLGLASAAIPTLSLRVATYEDNKCEKFLQEVNVTYTQNQVKWGGGPCETTPGKYAPDEFKSFKILTQKNPHPEYYHDDTTTVNAFTGIYGQQCDPSSYISKQTFTKKERGSCTESTYSETYQGKTYVYGAGSLRLNSYAPGP